jgi:outer membrane protein assembly factor BamE
LAVLSIKRKWIKLMYHAAVLIGTKPEIMRAGFPLLTSLLLLAACSSSPIPTPHVPSFSLTPHKMDIPQGNLITPDMRDRVKPGMTRSQVRLALGTPLLADPFHGNRWDYVYTLDQKGKRVQQQRYTVIFDGDRVVRVDDSDMPPLSDAASAATETSSFPSVFPWE